MKILQVANGYPPAGLGGAEVYTHDLAQGLARRGHQINVFCRHSDLALPDYHAESSTVDGIAVYRVVNDHKHSVSFRDTFIDPRVEELFQAYTRRVRPELIHFNHVIGLSARLPLIAAELGIPFLVTLHDYWPICHQIRLVDWQGRQCPGPQNGGDCAVCIQGNAPASPQRARLVKWIKSILSPRMRRRIRQALFRTQSLQAQPTALALDAGDLGMRAALFERALLRAQAILTPSRYLRAQYAANGYPAERITVLPLGIDVPPPASTPAQPAGMLTIAAVGALIPAKGQHILIQAFNNIRAENIRLRLYGRSDVDPHYTRALKRLAAADARIEFMGPFSPEQRAAIYHSIDVLAQPSTFPETFSLAAREALACGKPVLAARIGALSEVVTDAVNGFLFEPGSVEELSAILEAITADPGRLARLELPGPVEILSVEEHTRRVEALYQKALNQ